MRSQLTSEEIFPLALPIFERIVDMPAADQDDALHAVESFVRSMLRHPGTTGGK